MRFPLSHPPYVARSPEADRFLLEKLILGDTSKKGGSGGRTGFGMGAMFRGLAGLKRFAAMRGH